MAAIAAVLPVSALAQSALNTTPSRVVGQPAVNFQSTSPNVVEGRELLSPLSAVIDRTSTPPALYVADAGNNRVLVWRNADSLQNGAKADFVIGQVDLNSTQPLGPNTPRTGGLSAPGALALDREGNLYVVDTGNNRILRFRKPLESREEIQFPDLVIGQANFASDAANAGGISERSIAISSGGSAARAGIAFDAQGNLWFTDSLNHRVLRYPAASLAAGRNQPAADLVLGQAGFNAVLPPPGQAPEGGPALPLIKTFVRNPTAVAIDNDGRVYVADTLGRVLVYLPPFANGKEAARVAGVLVTQPGQPTRLEFLIISPQGLFVVNNRLGVVDASLSRIVIYDAFSAWAAESEEQPSPPARVVIGQSGFSGTQPNRGLAEPSDSTLFAPSGASWNGTELVVADTGNHRVLIVPQPTSNPVATKVIGQQAFTYNSPNLVEGRELFVFNGFSAQANLAGGFSDGGGVAIDTRSNPPRLYVADTFNNRVLAYRDARRVLPNDPADFVIGQNDLNRTLTNAPQNNRDSQNDTGLFRPSGLAVDASGDLFVADSGNGRILRFPSPFQQTIAPGERHRANLVLGQGSFTARNPDPSARNMAYPFGIALTGEGHLVASDAVHNRVLFFRRGANGTFTNGQAAERVIGQPDFFTVAAGSDQKRMFSPRHVAIDTDDRLYVTDAGNNRVLVYDRVTVTNNDPTPAFTLTGVSAPQGIFVSALTGEIWVANTRGNAAVRYRRYEQLATNQQSDYTIPSSAPLALTQDAFGNLFIVEGINRVALHFNAIARQIAGNYADRPLSPGTIAILYPQGTGFSFANETRSFDQLPQPVPLPRELADVQVLVNGQPAPLYLVSPFQINFLMPMNTPTSGTAEVQVMRQSTGQIIAISNVPMERVSPALFVQGGALEGQLAAINQDGSINSPSSRARRGQYVTLFGTGQGFVPNAPPDGTPPAGPLPTEERPRVLIGGPDFLQDSDIQYSGLAPGLVGVWQLNVRIPEATAPSAAVEVAIQLRSVNSNRTTGNRIIRTTIAVDP